MNREQWERYDSWVVDLRTGQMWAVRAGKKLSSTTMAIRWFPRAITALDLWPVRNRESSGGNQ